jgi:rhodanese-related sulfurtransferase
MARSSLVVALLIALGCAPAPKAGAAAWTRVDPAAFTAELAAPTSATAPARVIVDVREPELFAAGHIPGAINLPWPDAKEVAPKQLDPNAAIVLVCHGGPMGEELAGILADRGFRNVRNLAGGMKQWTGPVVTGT